MLQGMDVRSARHFLCGLLLGAYGMYWYARYGKESLNFVVNWLQQEADEYQAHNPALGVDTSWGPRRKLDR